MAAAMSSVQGRGGFESMVWMALIAARLQVPGGVRNIFAIRHSPQPRMRGAEQCRCTCVCGVAGA